MICVIGVGEKSLYRKLFKKGDSSLPENYRPIALVPVGYKVLASLIHQRLLDSGIDQFIWPSQYGFRPKRGCADALMVIRRMIDATYNANTTGLAMVFLDWAKAFDRIRSDSLLQALTIFGLPQHIVEMIGVIYESATNHKPQRSDAYGGIKTIILIQHKKCLCFIIHINKTKGTKRN